MWSKGLSNLSNLIKYYNTILETLDALEEQRPLFLEEFNFRKILKEHILRLLRYQKEYWKKRYTIRWTKFGDENTSFFHEVVTERYMLNTITSLETDDGRTICDHHEKVALFLEEYKQRMGCTAKPMTLYNLSQVVQTKDNLESLARPFSIDDIDKVIKQMSTNKAPSPDGFNGFFLKNCWNIIKEDLYHLCFDFFNGLESIKTPSSP